ncbi:G2/mitotic-specific cyclin-B3 [Ctenodactylus gundi]
MPLPPQSFKPETETKKFQSSKIVPTARDQSKKMSENYRAKISPSLSQEILKKRSAFEDLTNASQNQTVLSKKEANMKFVRDVSKKINRNKHALELAKYNELKKKRYKLEVSPVVDFATSETNIMEKPLLRGISTNSQTSIIEEASFFKKPLVLKEEPVTEETVLTEKSLKKFTNHGEASLLEESLFLKEETDDDSEFVIQPMIFDVKQKSEEASIIKKTLSLKMCPYQEAQSCWEDLVMLQDSNVEENSISVKPMNIRNKLKTEETPSVKKPLPLNKVWTTVEKITHVTNPLILQKIASEEKLVTKGLSSFKREPTNNKESLFWEPSTLQEKHITEQVVSILDKPLTLLEKIDFKDSSLFKELPAFKEKPTTEEVTLTTKPLFLRKKHMTQRKTHTAYGKKYLTYWKKSALKPLDVQLVTYGENSLTNELLCFKKFSPGKDSLLQGPSALEEKERTQEGMSTLKKPVTLRKSPIEGESLTQKALTFKKQHTIKKATSNKKSLPLKKQQHTTPRTVTSGEKSLIKEPLSFKEENMSLKKRKCTTQAMPHWIDLSAWQDIVDKYNSLFLEPVSFKMCKTEETVLSKSPLSFKRQITQEKTTYEDESPCKKFLPFKKQPASEGEFLFVEQSELKDRRSSREGVSPLKETLTLQEKTTSKAESYSKEPVALKETCASEGEFFQELFSLHVKPISKDESLLHKSSVLQVKTDTKEDLLKKLLAFQEQSTISEESLFSEFLLLKRELSAEAAASQQRQLPIKKSTVEGQAFLLKKQLALHDNITNDEFLMRQSLVLQEKAIVKEPLSMQENPNTEKEAHTINMEIHFKEYLALQKKPSIEEIILQDPLLLQEKPSFEKRALFTEPLAFQEYPGPETEDSLKERLTLQDKCSPELQITVKQPLDVQKFSLESEAMLKDPLAMKKKPIPRSEATLWESLVLQKQPSLELGTMLQDPLTLQEKPSPEIETTLKGPLAFQEKPSTEIEAIFKELFVFQRKSSIEKELVSKEPLITLQEKSTISAGFLFKEMLALNEKSTFGKELSFQEPLVLEENPTHMDDTFTKTFLILENSPYGSSNALEPRTVKSSAANISSMGESSVYGSGSKKPFLPQSSRTQELLIIFFMISKQMSTLQDFDKEHSDPVFYSTYTKEIFSYMKDREEKFILRKYMNRQIEVTSDMRAILVDWLVEVQMSFEVSHETLYLAVKLVDHYLMEALCRKDKLQLLGATAFLIAAKFEEPSPPCMDDFLYICEDIYQRQEMLAMEVKILKTLKFDINIPVSYHFLRRYATCLHASMKTLTLSRFICEMTLQKYDYINERASKLAAASFLLALYMKNLGHWAPTLEYYSGYKTFDLHPLVKRLNMLLTSHSCDRLKTVYTKYSHQVFFEVSKIPPLEMAKLEKILSC